MRKMFCAAATAAITMVLSVGTASAAPPEHFEFHEEFELDIPCDGFSLFESVTVDGHGTDYFDRNGTFIRSEVIVHFVGVITGPGGLVLRDPGYFHETFSNDGTYRAVGLVFNIVVPGQGSIVQDTGYIKFLPDGTVEIHGPHEAFDAGDGPPLVCAPFE